jgi:hypothetical protein
LDPPCPFHPELTGSNNPPRKNPGSKAGVFLFWVETNQ